MAQPVRHACHPVCPVISIGSLAALRVCHLLLPVHGIISIGGHMALCVRFRQPVAVGIIGVSQSIPQRIFSQQHPVHPVVGKDALLSLPVCDGCHCARRIISINGAVSGRICLRNAPALCIVGFGGDCAQRIGGPGQPVHGIITKTPYAAFRIRHANDAGPLVSIGSHCASGVGFGNKAVLFIIAIAHYTALRVRHGHQPVVFIICIGSHAAVVLRHRGDLSVSRVGIVSHGAVLSGLGQQISVSVIGIGSGYALSVRHGGQIPLPIVSAAFRCAIGIGDLGGTELIIVGIDGGISVGVHGGGAALAIREGYDCALRIGLLCDTSFCVIDISHHAVAVLVLPLRHPVLCVIGIAAPVSRRVGHSCQIARPVIGIADMVAVRQTNLHNSILFIQCNKIILP